MHAIDVFGPERFMFESNFPVDKLSVSYRVVWNAFKKIVADFSEEEKDAAWAKLRSLPRDSNPNRIRNRCQFTGRPRGNYRKFGISRIALRELALRGQLPGVRKSSW